MIEKLEYDENNSDKANYHPLYVLVYSLYYLLIELFLVIGVMFEEFKYKLEFMIGLTGSYFVLIIFWRPYHKAVNLHNLFLILNHGTVVVFFVICYVYTHFQHLTNDFYANTMYGIMSLIGLVMLGGYVRIWI